ncbi:hypothetical protein FBZ98_10266 [Rhizobium sp. ERR 922]|nr:hypothetical protein FBZ98_10266 [Rhizobium sp. ERR 922]TWB99138.1 hypothetical protein FBZ97_10266 [Rhizobium sp. ERR 942]
MRFSIRNCVNQRDRAVQRFREELNRSSTSDVTQIIVASQLGHPLQGWDQLTEYPRDQTGFTCVELSKILHKPLLKVRL